MLVGASVQLRSFLDPSTPAGHTVKGYGLVSYRNHRRNSTTRDLGMQLTRAMDRSISDLGVDPSDYTYGRTTVMDATAIISINGRR